MYITRYRLQHCCSNTLQVKNLKKLPFIYFIASPIYSTWMQISFLLDECLRTRTSILLSCVQGVNEVPYLEVIRLNVYCTVKRVRVVSNYFQETRLLKGCPLRAQFGGGMSECLTKNTFFPAKFRVPSRLIFLLQSCCEITVTPPHDIKRFPTHFVIVHFCFTGLKKHLEFHFFYTKRKSP